MSKSIARRDKRCPEWYKFDGLPGLGEDSMLRFTANTRACSQLKYRQKRWIAIALRDEGDTN